MAKNRIRTVAKGICSDSPNRPNSSYSSGGAGLLLLCRNHECPACGGFFLHGRNGGGRDKRSGPLPEWFHRRSQAPKMWHKRTVRGADGLRAICERKPRAEVTLTVCKDFARVTI